MKHLCASEKRKRNILENIKKEVIIVYYVN